MFNGSLSGGDIAIIVMLVLGAVVGGLFLLNRWASKKMVTQNEMIESTKQTMTLYVIDKKKAKAQESNLPKAVLSQLPKLYKFMKIPLVKVKVGPQILTMMCDKKVFEALPIKKNVKVDVAGIYILSMKVGKTDKDLKIVPDKKPIFGFLKK